jgi:hypothetical protein
VEPATADLSDLTTLRPLLDNIHLGIDLRLTNMLPSTLQRNVSEMKQGTSGLEGERFEEEVRCRD